MKNSELIAHLRNYTSKCPEADYTVINFMKNHTETINVLQTGLSILAAGISIATSTKTILGIDPYLFGSSKP